MTHTTKAGGLEKDFFASERPMREKVMACHGGGVVGFWKGKRRREENGRGEGEGQTMEKKEGEGMQKRRVREVAACIEGYFASRRRVKKDGEGRPVVGRDGAVQYERVPATVTGLALALGLCRREELYGFEDEKIKALVSRALLRIEEEAEEGLFCKESFQGAKVFLAANFSHYRDGGDEEGDSGDLGVCTLWAE